MSINEKANIIIREGTPSDNEALVNLTSQTPMQGKISIRIDREPDFFRLLDMRGSSFVIVAELQNTIIGCCSASSVDVFVDGKPEVVFYLADFKIHPDYRKSTVAMRIGKAMLQKFELLDADLLFGTAAYGNDDVKPFFTGRAFLPKAEEVGIFNVFLIIPTSFKKKNIKYHLGEVPLISSTISFFNNFMKKYQLGPVYSESSFDNNILITASFNNELVAAITLFDTGPAKQNVLIQLPLFLKCIIKSIGALNTIYTIVRLPKINEVVQILYIKSFACKQGHEEALKLLLGRARNIAHEKKYTFLTIGIHEKDPLIKIFANYLKITFKSVGYVTSLKNNKDKINYILKGIPFEDYSLV